MNAAIYIRVSTEEQAETGYSLQAQERACRLYCELHSYAAAATYTDDGYSGTSGNRPQFQKLLEDAAQGSFTRIVVHKLDRFARNTSLLLNTIDDLGSRGIVLISVVEQIDFSTPIGKVLLSLLGAFGQFYVDNLRSETAKGLHEKAKRGLWVGPVPFGYCKQDKGTIVPSDDAETVQEIYRLYANDGYSYWQIAERLNRQGKQMYRWKERDHVPFSREAVRGILKNRAYLGYVSAGGQEHAGAHTALIDEATWYAVRELASKRTHRTGPKLGTPALLKGLCYCALCERKMWFRLSGRNGDSHAYGCPGRECENEQARAAIVEHQALDLLRLLAQPVEEATPEALRKMLETVVQKLWVRGSEIVAVTPVRRYETLIGLLGWDVRDS